MPVYTRTGDNGTTALFGGKRVLKCEELVDVYGSIDEVNSWIGVLLSTAKGKKESALLVSIQQDLFLIGSVLAGWNGDITPLTKRVAEMEKHIDAIEHALPPLNHFILPGGSPEAARIHVVRSIVRRVERQTVALFSKKRTVTKQQKRDQNSIVSYLNRLSDLLFTIARGINKTVGVTETIWIGTPNKHKG